jgi:hypothetical protein
MALPVPLPPSAFVLSSGVQRLQSRPTGARVARMCATAPPCVRADGARAASRRSVVKSASCNQMYCLLLPPHVVLLGGSLQNCRGQTASSEARLLIRQLQRHGEHCPRRRPISLPLPP